MVNLCATVWNAQGTKDWLNCDDRGKQVGTHEGIENFTIGQRKGLGVAMLEPYFVVKLDSVNNEVVSSASEKILQRTELWADGCNWLTDNFDDDHTLSVQIRYNSSSHAATVNRFCRWHNASEISQSGGRHRAQDNSRLYIAGNVSWVVDGSRRPLRSA